MVKRRSKREADRDISLFSKPESLSKEQTIQIIEYLKKQLEISKYELPVSIFDNKSLSALEAIVKYLKEEFDLGYVKISRLLNRSDKTIWVTYQKAKKKMPKRLCLKKSKIFIPLSIFSERKISVLENVVAYMKSYGLSYREISILLNRSYRTVVTVYNRFKKKNEKEL